MVNINDEQKISSPLTPEQPTPSVETPKPAPEQEPVEAPKETEKSAADRSKLEETGTMMKDLLSLKRRPKQVVIPQVRDDVTVKIEKIMEEGVGDAYTRLSPVARQEFKLKGEETARGIRELLKSTHVKVKKIFQLILAWLKLLPGINKFFLEQEAKIKTDRIIALSKKEPK